MAGGPAFRRTASHRGESSAAPGQAFRGNERERLLRYVPELGRDLCAALPDARGVLSIFFAITSRSGTGFPLIKGAGGRLLRALISRPEAGDEAIVARGYYISYGERRPEIAAVAGAHYARWRANRRRADLVRADLTARAGLVRGLGSEGRRAGGARQFGDPAPRTGLGERSSLKGSDREDRRSGSRNPGELDPYCARGIGFAPRRAPESQRTGTSRTILAPGGPESRAQHK